MLITLMLVTLTGLIAMHTFNAHLAMDAAPADATPHHFSEAASQQVGASADPAPAQFGDTCQPVHATGFTPIASAPLASCWMQPSVDAREIVPAHPPRLHEAPTLDVLCICRI